MSCYTVTRRAATAKWKCIFSRSWSGIQMLLMNTLEPLLCGEKLTREQVAAHFRQVQTTKAAKAQELLAKRSQKQEK